MWRAVKCVSIPQNDCTSKCVPRLGHLRAGLFGPRAASPRPRAPATKSVCQRKRPSQFRAKLRRPGVPWHRSEVANQIAPVHRLKPCREAPAKVVDPETTAYRMYAPTQEGGQLCFPAKP